VGVAGAGAGAGAGADAGAGAGAGAPDETITVTLDAPYNVVFTPAVRPKRDNNDADKYNVCNPEL
jgi:hypothetical protein